VRLAGSGAGLAVSVAARVTVSCALFGWLGEEGLAGRDVGLAGWGVGFAGWGVGLAGV